MRALFSRARPPSVSTTVTLDDSRNGQLSDNLRSRFLAEAALATWILRQRRKREDVLGAHHFADPSWDIMLDLFSAQVHGEKVATSSLIVAANVSQSTALRRIRRLVRDGDLVAERDPHDGRRTFVRLSCDLFERIGGLLRQWQVLKG
ncbi:MarR family transcriptional regulator [Sphingomonas sp. SUN019]|uniref:MarR family transcriptional regulator n=1 Tax=Sphingomonas sp. SUN019 TaxID=2937788 RepID=UPI0021648757|nr:MarR family transcriptional regulator [Sphingomonas sp. SUN019]UVO50144.1 MarR family transcriptional regulator [Sphingomonas sp. SUN019]